MPDVESRPVFAIPLALLLLMGAYAIAGGLDKWADEREAAPAAHHPLPITHHLELDLRDCSPARVELSPIVYVAITTHPGADPDILGCSRYAVIPQHRRTTHKPN